MALTATAWIIIDSVTLPGDPASLQASEIYYRDGVTLLARVGVTSRTDVPLRNVPEHVRHAVLAAEDRDYYEHSGVSIRGVARATWANLTGDDAQGASTITQQYARNAFLTQERSVTRKSREAVLAVKLENRYSKDEIFERYLNTIYFGRGAYGIAAASIAYFGVPVGRLTVAQGTVLAAVIKDPWNFDPAIDPTGARDRWRWIVDSMGRLGWTESAQASTEGYPSVLTEPPQEATLAGANGAVVGVVERELAQHGISPQRLHTAGLRVISTLDAAAQKAAVATIPARLTGEPAGLHAALVAVDPRTGAVRAYFGGDQGYGFFDDAQAPRSPGFAFAPVVLAAGLQSGVSYYSLVDGRSPQSFADRGGVPLYNTDNQQCFPCTPSQAAIDSVNTAMYSVAQQVGGTTVRRLAHAMGIAPNYLGRPSLVDGPGDPRPNHTRADIALGIYPTSPADLATVYATLANSGMRSDRHAIDKVMDSGGGEIYHASPTRVRALTPAAAEETANLLNSTLTADLDDTWLGGAGGKAGTRRWGDTKDNQDAWLAGFVPDLAVVVWVGRPTPGPIRDRRAKPIAGTGLPATIWLDFVRAVFPEIPSVTHAPVRGPASQVPGRRP